MPNKTALFRLSVLGVLTSRIDLGHGEIKELIKSVAQQHFDIPNSTRTQISARTIERWYYAWKKHGIGGLTPKLRSDKGGSGLSDQVKQRIVELKKENMCRSVNTILELIFDEGLGKPPRSSVHRLLKQEDLSHRVVSDGPSIERRQFEAMKASDIWYSDVMHGPHILHEGKSVKVYLVSFMDDASRLLTHSEFCFDEQAVSVERVLKEAVMRRGLPKRLIVDNGSAYRSKSLIEICGRLDIRLIFCRPYEPQGKGKLERWHRTVRDQFLTEIKSHHINCLLDLNERLHAWIEETYHQRKHSSLDNKTPMQRFREDIPHTRRLGELAKNIDEIFYHRIERTVSSTAAIKYEGKAYEVEYQYAKKKIFLVFDPHLKSPRYIEDKDGNYLCEATPLDKTENLYRSRQRPDEIEPEIKGDDTRASVVESALSKHRNKHTLGDNP